MVACFSLLFFRVFFRVHQRQLVLTVVIVSKKKTLLCILLVHSLFCVRWYIKLGIVCGVDIFQRENCNRQKLKEVEKKGDKLYQLAKYIIAWISSNLIYFISKLRKVYVISCVWSLDVWSYSLTHSLTQPHPHVYQYIHTSTPKLKPSI